MTKHQTQDPLADLTAQAEQAFSSGDRQAARQIWEAMLQIDPEHPAARSGLERLGAGSFSASPPPEPAGGESALSGPPAESEAPAPGAGLDLELDLDLLDGPSVAAPSPSPAPKPMEGASVRELLEAAEEIDPVAPVEGVTAPDGVDTGGEVATEVLELVARARDALADGDTAEATRLASRAQAMDESAPGAQEIVEQARTLEQLKADRAEYQLRDAIHAFERQAFDDARALFESVLESVPDHAEARDYLGRIESARLQHAAVPDGSSPFEDTDMTGVTSIPLGESAMHPQGTGEVATGPDDEVTTLPPVDSTASTAPPEPPPLPRPDPAAGPATAPPPGDGAPPPVPEVERPSVPAPPPPASGRAAVPGGLRRGLVLGLALVGLLAAGWYAARTLGLLGADRVGETIARSMAAEVRKAAAAAIPAAASAAQEAEASPGVETAAPVAADVPASDPPDSPVERPRYTRRDVPRLVARARAALGQGDEAGAVELLTIAQQADPTNFDVLEELEAARDALRERRDAQERIASGRNAFAQGNYEEALRLFYRVPQRYRPSRLDLWIAAGWYNLGVLALQARSAGEAQRFFNDCLELDPQDEDARRHREVARRYRRRPFDEAYGIYVSNLTLRTLPD